MYRRWWSCNGANASIKSFWVRCIQDKTLARDLSLSYSCQYEDFDTQATPLASFVSFLVVLLRKYAADYFCLIGKSVRFRPSLEMLHICQCTLSLQLGPSGPTDKVRLCWWAP